MDKPIKGGYYLKAKKIKDSNVSFAPPYMREIWDYLLRKSKFKDTKHLKFTVKRGQIFTSYQKIVDELKWKVGNRSYKYSKDQVHKAFKFFRKEGMIVSVKKARGVLVTICNYNYFQDWKNYESHLQQTVIYNKNNTLQEEKNPESHLQRPESHSSAVTQNMPESHSESQLEKAYTVNNNNGLQELENPESHSESHNKNMPESHSTAPSIIEYTPDTKSINNIYKRILPDPENDEIDFERDRRIFFEAFPGVKTFQLFDDNTDRKDKSLIKQFHLKNTMPIKYTLRMEELNGLGAGVYLCINETDGKARTAKNITQVRAVFADLDGVPIDPVWQYEPSMVVESSQGKYHAYWFTTDTPLAGFRQIQECISEKFGSDPKVKDLPRVMRIPGFFHMKKEPFLSRLLHYTGQQFAFDYLTDMFPPPPRVQWSAPKYQHKELNPNTEFKGQYGAGEGGRNNHVAARIGGMIKKHMAWAEIENEAFKEAAACSPPLSEREVRETLKSLRRYA